MSENILFGSAWDADAYDAALAACCLHQDIDQLVDGDATEIGPLDETIIADVGLSKLEQFVWEERSGLKMVM